MEKRCLLQLIYCIALLLANWFDPRLIAFGGITVDAGTLVFPLTYVMADILTEVYGYKYSRFTIWLGIGTNLFFIAYGELIAILPSPAFALKNNNAFDAFLQMDFRVVAASLISYFCAEPLNAILLAKLKIKFQGRWMAIRFLVSSLIAAALDTFLFSIIAFYGIIPLKSLGLFILTIWAFKVLIEIAILPISIKLARFLKRREQLDRYDTHTKFNLFSWDVNYEKNN